MSNYEYYTSNLITGLEYDDPGLPPPGTQVRAVVRIDDVNPEGEVYTHAEVGDTGVIEGYYGEDNVPTIDWNAGSGYGYYDCQFLTQIVLVEE